jgi:hypothetical protein
VSSSALYENGVPLTEKDSIAGPKAGAKLRSWTAPSTTTLLPDLYAARNSTNLGMKITNDRIRKSDAIPARKTPNTKRNVLRLENLMKAIPAMRKRRGRFTLTHGKVPKPNSKIV